jgi:hypothetical protein
MGLQLVDAGRWRDATVLLEHALATKDRSERMTVIADRLVDYTPHMHLAKAYHRLGVLREAFLHLELARNEENASPQALRALRVLLDKDRERPLIHLEPLPDRTTAEQVTIRGVIISRQAAERVEVAGHKALLRSAAPEEVEALLAEHGRGLEARHSQGVRFEIPDFRLGLGENLIRVRPFFGAAGDDGDLVETLIVRVRPASPAQDEAPGSPPGDGPATAGPSGAAP